MPVNIRKPQAAGINRLKYGFCRGILLLMLRGIHPLSCAVVGSKLRPILINGMARGQPQQTRLLVTPRGVTTLDLPRGTHPWATTRRVAHPGGRGLSAAEVCPLRTVGPVAHWHGNVVLGDQASFVLGAGIQARIASLFRRDGRCPDNVGRWKGHVVAPRVVNLKPAFDAAVK